LETKECDRNTTVVDKIADPDAFTTAVAQPDTMLRSGDTRGLQMHRFLMTFVAVLSAIAFMRTASGADLPVKAPLAPPVYNWTGFYVGVNAGFGRGRNDADFTGDGPNGAGNDLISRVFDGPLNFSQKTRSQGIDAEGAFGGGQFGYNWQFAGAWLAGLEADIQASGLHGSFTKIAPLVPLSLSAEQKLEWFGTARGRLGYVVNERFLVFGTGGLAYGQTEETSSFFSNGFGGAASVRSTITCVVGSPCLAGQSSNISAGWTAGAGVEWAVRDNATVKFEYLHIALPDSTLVMSTVAPATGNGTVTATFRNQFDMVRAGVNLRF
jgi:outer membrane immunogenic protein